MVTWISHFCKGEKMFRICKLCAGLAAFLILCSCNEDKKASAEADKPTAISVDAVQVEPQNIPLSFEFSARAQGYKETQVRARVGGILLKKNYIEGAEVKEGDVLFEIDPNEYRAKLNNAKANLAKAQAQLHRAETEWDRIEKLFKQRVVSEKSRDDALAELESQKAAVLMAESEVETAQLNFDYTKVTAPISGVTGMEEQSVGSLISATGLLTTITQLDPIYVIFSASESEMMSLANMVRSGLVKNPENKSEVIAKVKFSNDVFYPLDGEINFINSGIDEGTGTIKLRAVFPNPKRQLKPGQFLRLVMEGLTRINALVVPQESIMQGGNGSYLYIVNDKNMVEAVNVQTGLMTKEGGWIIDGGLKAGDKVIISNLMKIRPGMTVEPNMTEVLQKNEDVED